MNEKKHRILEESAKLFAEKGYHSTSIQEIVDQCDISKGSFYLYFSSKEELAIEIIKYYSTFVFEKVAMIRKEAITPREKLTKQVKMLINLVNEHKEFVLMYLRDNVKTDNNVEELIVEMNQENFAWLKKSIYEVYGKEITPYLADAIILLEGMIQGYFNSIVLFRLRVDAESLAQFIVNRFDDLVIALLEKNESAQIKLIDIEGESRIDVDKEQTIKKQIEQLLEMINELDADEWQKRQWLAAVQTVEDEWNKTERNMVIIQGLLTELSRINHLKSGILRIRDTMKISLNQ